MTERQSNIIVFSFLGIGLLVLLTLALALAFQRSAPEPKWNRNPAYAETTSQDAQPREKVPIEEAKSAAPASAENSATLLIRSEQFIRAYRGADAADTMNRIIREFPDNPEAGTVKGLVRLLRQQGSTPYTGSVSSCTVDEANRLNKQLDTMENIACN